METSSRKEEQCSHSDKSPLLAHSVQQLPTTNRGATVAAVAPESTHPCWICQSNDRQDELFKPCNCPTICHRDCFRKWRSGWINPRNYFSCPNCLFSYRIERLREASTESKQKIKQRYRMDVLKLWLATILIFGALIGLLATICYFSDKSEKNIPVAIKYMLTSVVNGLPSGNSTTVWTQNFKKPNVHVWPYYMLFATFIASVLILIGFAMIGCTFKESERSSRGQSCCNDCCQGSDGTWVYCFYLGGDPCPGCNECCNRSVCDCKGGCAGCGGSDCKMDGIGEAFIIIIIIVVIAVIISAIFVVILYAVQKWALLYDRVSDMLMNQQSELEGETVVLAVNETWRPHDTV